MPEAGWVLYGIKPVVVAIIAQALWTLASKALKNRTVISIGLIVFGLYFLGINEILLLFGAGLVYMFIANVQRLRTIHPSALVPYGAMALAQTAIPFSVSTLFLTFLKIGSVLYGSGYVLLAFLRSDFVLRLGWITDCLSASDDCLGGGHEGELDLQSPFIDIFVPEGASQQKVLRGYDLKTDALVKLPGRNLGR